MCINLVKIAAGVAEICWKYINNIYIIYVIFIYIVICVPILVEIAPGVPELCWNIHTHIHPFLYI
jgi:hypothetical protein